MREQGYCGLCGEHDVVRILTDDNCVLVGEGEGLCQICAEDCDYIDSPEICAKCPWRDTEEGIPE